MKNWEKYEKLIRENEGAIAIKGGTDKVIKCTDIMCENCMFFSFKNPCAGTRIDWLYQEYEEKQKLTKRERMFCEMMGYGWVSKDLPDLVSWHSKNPYDEANLLDGISYLCLSELLNLKFSFLKPEEPWAVEDLLTLEVDDD